MLMCHAYDWHLLCIGNSWQEKVSSFSWPVPDRQQGIDWHKGVVEDGSLSPTSPLDWRSSNAEYLEQFGRNSGQAPFLHQTWVGNGRFIDLIVYDPRLIGKDRLEG